MVAERLVPGLPEAMRAAGLAQTPHAMLSRGVAVIRGCTLIVNLPGSPKGRPGKPQRHPPRPAPRPGKTGRRPGGVRRPVKGSFQFRVSSFYFLVMNIGQKNKGQGQYPGLIILLQTQKLL